MDFLEWKFMNFYLNFTEVSSYGSNKQYSIIGSDNGLAPSSLQAYKPLSEPMTVSLLTHYASLGLNELMIAHFYALQ